MVRVHLDVIFNSQPSVFPSGALLEGKVLVLLKEPTPVSSLSLKIRGKAQTGWSSYSGKNSISYTGKEIYLDHQRSDLLPDDFHLDKLPEGKTEIPFSLRLPDDLPSSFEGNFGNIRYIVTVTLKRPSLRFDTKCRRSFSVVGREDLNLIPGAGLPLEYRDTRDLVCCFLNLGCVDLSLRIPRRGFVPGQLISLAAEISNHSKKKLRLLSVLFCQHLTYHGTTTFAGFGGKREETIEISRTERLLGIAPGDTSDFDDFRVPVPSLPPRLSTSHIIHIHYSLRISIGVLVEVQIPILIGTIPLTAPHGPPDSLSVPRGAPPAYTAITQEPLSLATRSEANEPPPPYSTLQTCLPSYQECVLRPRPRFNSASDREDEDGMDSESPNHQDYSPLYPVFSFGLET